MRSVLKGVLFLIVTGVFAQEVDYQFWDQFLARYGETAPVPDRVNYRAVTPSDLAGLEEMIRGWQTHTPSKVNARDARAYWINLYNAVTVLVVLKHYPVSSIRDIKFGNFLASGPWDKVLVTVEGRPLSLNDIEHRILRVQWKVPETHYLLNCASMGCPQLPLTAVRGATLEAQGAAAAKTFLTSRNGLRFDGNTLVLSSLFQWFAGDFGANFDAVRKHLASYLPPELAEKVRTWKGPVRYEYDWRLNDV